MHQSNGPYPPGPGQKDSKLYLLDESVSLFVLTTITDSIATKFDADGNVLPRG